jgi:hypothetical protein
VGDDDDDDDDDLMVVMKMVMASLVFDREMLARVLRAPMGRRGGG